MMQPSSCPRVALAGGRVLVPSGDLVPATLLLEGTRIAGLLTPGETLPPDTQVLDVSHCYVAPGFIDSHTHGGAGQNFMAGSEAALAAISAYMAQGGVTSCLATTTSAALPDLERALAAAAAAVKNPVAGRVNVLGIHLEGPYLNPQFRGVHAEQFVRAAALPELEALWAAAGPALKVVTLAPEIPGGMAAVEFFASRGVQVSLGHTGATYEQAKLALARGVRRATHLFNAMPPIHHRNPGPPVALLEDTGAFLELTVDGLHVHPAVVALVLRLVGPERVVLITDSIDVAGLGDGVFTRWEGTQVLIKDGKSVTRAGSLAGSTLTLDQAVRNLVNLVGVPVAQALRMAAETPARALGWLDRKGTLAPGKDADVVVLDSQLAVVLTLAGGQIIYRRDGAAGACVSSTATSNGPC